MRIRLTGLQIQSFRRKLGEGHGFVPLELPSFHPGQLTFADSKRNLNVPFVLDNLGLHLNVGIAGVTVIRRQVADAAAHQVVAEFTVGKKKNWAFCTTT